MSFKKRHDRHAACFLAQDELYKYFFLFRFKSLYRIAGIFKASFQSSQELTANASWSLTNAIGVRGGNPHFFYYFPGTFTSQSSYYFLKGSQCHSTDLKRPGMVFSELRTGQSLQDTVRSAPPHGRSHWTPKGTSSLGALLGFKNMPLKSQGLRKKRSHYPEWLTLVSLMSEFQQNLSSGNCSRTQEDLSLLEAIPVEHVFPQLYSHDYMSSQCPLTRCDRHSPTTPFTSGPWKLR